MRHIPFNRVWYYGRGGKDGETTIYDATIVGHTIGEDGKTYYFLDIDNRPYNEGGWIVGEESIGPREYGKSSVVRYVADYQDKERREKHYKDLEQKELEKKKTKKLEPKKHNFF